jgi:cytochrome c oxidase assembly protein subunit 15
MTLVRRLAVSALVLQMVLVVTGTAVRVTNSGLGCPTWPRCTGGSLTNTPELGAHGFIEFGNRLLTVLMVLVGIALVPAVRRVPHPRSWTRLALVQASVVPLQAVVGGILVLSGLNPYVLIAHFLASFPLIYAAAALLRGVLGGGPPTTDPLLRALSAALLVTTVAVLVLGTLVTGTGPHAGGTDVERLGFDPRSITQLHADAVFVLVGLTLATVLVAWRTPWRRWAVLLLGLVSAQGAIGYWQYFTSVPPVLVGMHVAGATLTFTTVAWLHVSLAQPSAELPPQTAAPTPVRA